MFLERTAFRKIPVLDGAKTFCTESLGPGMYLDVRYEDIQFGRWHLHVLESCYKYQFGKTNVVLMKNIFLEIIENILGKFCGKFRENY